MQENAKCDEVGQVKITNKLTKQLKREKAPLGDPSDVCILLVRLKGAKSRSMPAGSDEQVLSLVLFLPLLLPLLLISIIPERQHGKCRGRLDC